MNHLSNRRSFLTATSRIAVGFGLASLPSARAARRVSANDKLNIAMIGTANQAGWNLGNIASENIVALVDVDSRLLNAALSKHPKAAGYSDFRKAFERKDIDAVVIGTPDHTHAPATAAAIRSGRHVYCEKPLTRTISECRKVRELARQHGVATQMGTQIHSGKNYRTVVDLIRSGAIGEVREAHVWVGSGFGNRERPTTTPAVPQDLNYDLWLGPVAHRPYHPDYLPFHWRNWWAFGGGTLADLGCHHMDLVHWALGLQTPETVEIIDGPKPHPESAPHFLVAQYEYAARQKSPPVTVRWYHGGKRPAQFASGALPKWGDGSLFIGDKGRMLLAGYDRYVLLPENDFKDFKRPPALIPDSIGHHQEWIHACKTGAMTTCNFDYSGALTEAVLLGNVAFRAQCKIHWDSRTLQATGCSQADEFIQHHYRKGWRL